MMATPGSSRSSRSKGSANSASSETPPSAPQKGAIPKSSNKRKACASASLPAIAEADGEDKEDKEDEDDEYLSDIFDGSKTVRDVGAMKKKFREKYLDTFVLRAEFDEALHSMKNEYKNQIEEIIDEFKKYTTAAEARITHLELTASSLNGRDKSFNDWDVDRVARLLVNLKLKSLNDSHAVQATNRDLLFRVDQDIIGVCLWCFRSGKGPEFCIFKKGKQGVYLHRKPKSAMAMNQNCAKPGIPDPHKGYDARMIFGKDYLQTRLVIPMLTKFLNLSTELYFI